MKLAEQQSLVDEWSVSASAWGAMRRQHREAMHAWTQERFGSPWMLAWAFAAGAWVGAVRGREPDESQTSTRKYVGLVNTAVLAWRLLA